MTHKDAQQCFADGATVHFDVDDRQWGRVATDGEIVEVLTRRTCLVNAYSIRANIVVKTSELRRLVMREIKVLVTLQVDECEPNTKIDRDTMQNAAVEAVANAVRHAENNGFSHTWSDDLSIGFVGAVLYRES